MPGTQAKPMAAASLQKPVTPSSPQALATTKQITLPDDLSLDLGLPDAAPTPAVTTTVTDLPDAAEAAVAAGDAADAADMAAAAAEAAGEALGDDEIGECSEDFEKVLCEIIDSVEDDTAALEAIFASVSKHQPCGVKVEYVLNKCVEMDVPIPEPEIVVPVIDEPEELDDEPELEIIADLVEEEEPCVCEISESDIEAAENLIEDSFTGEVTVDVDEDTGVVTVTDDATDEVTDKFDVETLIDVIDVADEVEEAEDDGEEVEPVVVIDNVQEILEDATNDKAEEGIPPNELADDECCGCCGCCCDCDHE